MFYDCNYPSNRIGPDIIYFLRYKNKKLELDKINNIIVKLIYKNFSNVPDKPVNTYTPREDKLPYVPHHQETTINL